MITLAFSTRVKSGWLKGLSRSVKRIPTNPTWTQFASCLRVGPWKPNQCFSHLFRSMASDRKESQSAWTRRSSSNENKADSTCCVTCTTLWLLVNESMMSLNVLEQAARALRDHQLLDVLKHMQDRNERQLVWLKTRINQAAPQVLVVPL